MMLTPSVRKVIYGALGAMTVLYAVAYLVLAVVAPEAAARLLDALPALLPVLASGLGNVLAWAKVDLSTASGAPADEV